MKTKASLFILLISFLFTSCYTQFSTPRDDNYTVRDDRYKTYGQDQNYDDDDSAYVEENADDEYYEDDDAAVREIYITEYPAYARPYVYRYRFTHYNPADYYYDDGVLPGPGPAGCDYWGDGQRDLAEPPDRWVVVPLHRYWCFELDRYGPSGTRPGAFL